MKQEILQELYIGTLGSLLAAFIVYIISLFYPYLAANLIMLVLLFFIFLFFSFTVILCYRWRSLRVPGLNGWLVNRESTDYLYNLLHKAEYSLEILTCTGSSTFVHGGKMMNTLTNKYKGNDNFITRILLLSPDAKEVIKYRKRRLGGEPNVLGSDDIIRTINLLNMTKSSIEFRGNQIFDYKIYDNELVWNIAIIDRKIVLAGFYGPGKSGWKWPVMIFKREPDSFYFAFEEQFDQRWQRAKSDVTKFIAAKPVLQSDLKNNDH